MNAPFQPGDRVKHSEYSLRNARDNWLRAGSSSLKSTYLNEYERQKSVVGTVMKCEMGKYAYGVTVKTDAGAVHQSMTNMWEAIV